MNNRIYAALFIALAVIVYWLGPFSAETDRFAYVEDYFDELLPQELREGLYFRMVDEAGRVIVITGRRLRPGDGYVTTDNRLYEVYAVEENVARARFKEEVKITQPSDRVAASEDRLFLQPLQLQPAYRIAIFHTHNAESYLPSDGTDSIYGRGGIHDVGVAFKEALEGKGVEVLHSERLHLPHDRGAYRRSRVTVQQLLAQRPDAIFDVHRDAAPWDAYSMEINGELITQIHFVVGLSNPGYAANRNYAFDLKGYADRIHPGLIRGIFLIWGGYNQDLTPMNLLLEVGAHTNTKEAAMRGITLFADVVAYYFYGPEYLDNGDPLREPAEEGALPPALYRDAGGISGAISGTVIGLLLTSLGAAFGFYFLNNPGALEYLLRWWEGVPERLAALPGRTVRFLRHLPNRINQQWVDFPGNLRFSWGNLRQDLRATPVYAKTLIKSGARLGAGIGRGGLLWLHRLPANWRRAWKFFLWESKKLPGFLQHRIIQAYAMLRDAINWLARVIPPVGNKASESLRLAWGRLATEAVHWVAAVRGIIALLQRRLRS